MLFKQLKILTMQLLSAIYCKVAFLSKAPFANKVGRSIPRKSKLMNTIHSALSHSVTPCCKSSKQLHAKDNYENEHSDLLVSASFCTVVSERRKVEEHLWIVHKSIMLDTRNESAFVRKILGYQSNIKTMVYFHICIPSPPKLSTERMRELILLMMYEIC